MSNAHICDRCDKVTGKVHAMCDSDGKVYDLCFDCCDHIDKTLAFFRTPPNPDDAIPPMAAINPTTPHT